MTTPQILASTCIGALLLGDRLEHLGYQATWGNVSAWSMRAAAYLRVASVLLGWLTIASLLITK